MDCSKFEIDILIDFWDMIVQEDDQIFIFFFSVALILQNKQVSSICYSFIKFRQC